MQNLFRKPPVVAMLLLVAISSSAGAKLLTEVVAEKLQAKAEAAARDDWRKITVLGAVAYIDDHGVARTAPPAPPAPPADRRR